MSEIAGRFNGEGGFAAAAALSGRRGFHTPGPPWDIFAMMKAQEGDFI